MCDPVIALVAGSTLVGAYGTIASSQAQASALKASGRADRAQAYQNELDARAKSRTALSEQLAALSDRGVDVSTGTPLDLLRASARNQEVDALRLRAQGLNAYNAKRFQASNALKTGWITAGGQILAGTAVAGSLGALGSIGGQTVPGMSAVSVPTLGGGSAMVGGSAPLTTQGTGLLGSIFG